MDVGDREGPLKRALLFRFDRICKALGPSETHRPDDHVLAPGGGDPEKGGAGQISQGGGGGGGGGGDGGGGCGNATPASAPCPVGPLMAA